MKVTLPLRCTQMPVQPVVKPEVEASTVRVALLGGSQARGHARSLPTARRWRAHPSSLEMRTWRSPSGSEGERTFPVGNMVPQLGMLQP